ncbi:RNA polymerase sigma factor [uncultured Muribaculum sp.]|jgi:RNA polymerase sigma-70 factor (ECF subfamily)|uniref:RNA polymerase sigma factor n=1 Tax=uncultured Muribaculum sp. TaxID=1918613 RepID=UPI002659E04F|nr:sigma-70 family RNA polymerase sigma factor [uncultured Muribaculum sp.]
MRAENFIDSQLQEKLHRVARRLLKDELDAEDAVQDAICNLWSDRIPATYDEARFRLFTILKNICINKLKRKRYIVELSDNDKTTDSINVDDTENIKSILLASLTPLQRKIFHMAAFDDIEYDIIAERLNISVEAVRMNMSRARKKMRELYNKM